MRDLRRYARQTTYRLVLGVLAILFTVGVGLIYLIYGEGAAVMGLLCLGAGLLPLVLIALVLWIMDRVVRRGRID
ncbi:MAG TPA: hypothetical protein VFF68_12750 [Anaerolineaceae bacterium]|nr:hypothetical protein [Anaerolineaceae bacterium]